MVDLYLIPTILNAAKTSTLKTGDEYEVTGRSLLLLAALTSGDPVTVIRRLALDLLHEGERPI